MEWGGIMEWGGVEWRGVEWSEVEWSGMAKPPPMQQGHIAIRTQEHEDIKDTRTREHKSRLESPPPRLLRRRGPDKGKG